DAALEFFAVRVANRSVPGDDDEAKINVPRRIRRERGVDHDAGVKRSLMLPVIFRAEEDELTRTVGAGASRVGVIDEIDGAADAGEIELRLRSQGRAKDRNLG